MRYFLILALLLPLAACEQEAAEILVKKRQACRMVTDTRSGLSEQQRMWQMTRCITVGVDAYLDSLDPSEQTGGTIEEIKLKAEAVLACQEKVRSLNKARSEPIFRDMPETTIKRERVTVVGNVEIGGQNGVVQPHVYTCYVADARVFRHKLEPQKMVTNPGLQFR